ncbi:Ig-like domain-containing protein [Neobacillus dielmonensis]|uniref:Ig-like domain-containing protein n=1 Tax=Neobacillus dielmonensis TaxID=1347369 RepID=UPI0005A7567B|nr:Ig-like domain-containing protein [Neobacillus dielmonensis]
MNIIESKATKYLVFASIITILLMFNFSSNAHANEEVLLPKGYIDAPASNAVLSGETAISGWFLDANGVSKIEVLIDGNVKGEAQYGISRPDVGQAYPGYQNANSGYKFILNTKNLTNGQHRLTVRETGKNGAVTELNSFLVNIQNVENLPARGYIDTPSAGGVVKGTIPVRGWFLYGSGISKIEIKVDGKSYGVAEYGISRLDVAKLFPEYKNANSGYQFSLNTQNLTNGQHKLTVKATGSNGAIKELESIVINVQNSPVRGYVDTPSTGALLKGEVPVNGWVLDGSGVSKVEVFVDGRSMGTAEYGISRLDVSRAYPEYGNSNAGYKFTLNTQNLANGSHKLTVKETGVNGLVTELGSLVVNVENLKTVGYMDAPANGASLEKEVSVSGWFLDVNGVAKIEVLVDGKNMGQAKYGGLRLDVLKAFPEYKNDKSGYQFVLDTKLITNGQHKVTVRETSNNGTMKELDSIVVNVNNLPAKGSIDTPLQGSVIKGEVPVRGWYLDGSGVSKVEVLVDGKRIGQANYGNSRPDVDNAFPEYRNAKSGYQFTLDTKPLTNGQHTITVREIGNNGMISEISNLIKVQNPPPKGSIDGPAYGATIKGETVSVTGWMLDLSGVSKIEVLMDGAKIGEAQYGDARTDVANAFPEYKTVNSGYQFTFNSLQFADGKHTLSIRETGKNGASYTTDSLVYIYNQNPYLQIDLRKPSNITANDIVNFFNQKRPDSPLKNYAQSFIDAQNKYGVSAQYLVAHAIWETGWGGSDLRTYKHNLFGYGAYDPCPFTCGYYFPNGSDAINYEAYIVRRDYLNETGSYYNGPNLTGMNIRYATDSNWKNGIANLMQSIKPFDAAQYFNSSVLPSSSTAAPSFGRNIPAGKPAPSNIIINYTVDTYATVINGPWSFRSTPYATSSTFLRYVNSGVVVKVLGYNTDVAENSNYPYDYRWYRVLVDGQEGWLYGGGLQF